MTEQQLIELINELVKQPQESEWVEFKLNFHSPEEIGEQISSLANGASIRNQDFGYLVFGVEDQTHIIKGTSFKAKSQRKGGEDLEHWLTSRLNPKIDFTVCEFEYDAHRHISLYVIPAAKSQPVEFLHQAYIRIGSITKNSTNTLRSKLKSGRRMSRHLKRKLQWIICPLPISYII